MVFAQAFDCINPGRACIVAERRYIMRLFYQLKSSVYNVDLRLRGDDNMSAFSHHVVAAMRSPKPILNPEPTEDLQMNHPDPTENVHQPTPPAGVALGLAIFSAIVQQILIDDQPVQNKETARKNPLALFSLMSIPLSAE
jgi:hypothetical protein